MRYPNLLIIETHHSGHHVSYLREILAAASTCHNRLVLLATRNVLGNLKGTPAFLPENLEVHCLLGLPGYKNLRNSKLSWTVFNLRRLAAYTALARRLELTKKETLIVFPTIYDNEFAGFSWSRTMFPFKCVGIYMNSHFFRRRLDLYHRDCVIREPRFLKDCRTRGIALLDPAIIAPAKAYAPRTSFTLVPDFVRTVAGNPGPQWDKLVKTAVGRPIVGLLGYLKRSKGILKFREAAAALGHLAFFVAAGELPSGDYSHEELLSLREESANPNSSFRLLEGRITTDCVFQGMIRDCSIICCAYEDFLSSSNQVSLAAVYGKYVVVPPQGCMTEFAKSQSNGIPVADDSLQSLCAAVITAVRLAKSNPVSSERIFRSRSILSDHAFRTAFTKLLSLS